MTGVVIEIIKAAVSLSLIFIGGLAPLIVPALLAAAIGAASAK
jgi:hypothetical protein